MLWQMAGVTDWGSDGDCKVKTGKDQSSDGVVAGRFGYHSILSNDQLDIVLLYMCLHALFACYICNQVSK